MANVKKWTSGGYSELNKVVNLVPPMNHDTEGPTNVMMSTMEIWQVKPDCVGELIWVDQSRVKYSLAFDD